MTVLRGYSFPSESIRKKIRMHLVNDSSRLKKRKQARHSAENTKSGSARRGCRPARVSSDKNHVSRTAREYQKWGEQRRGVDQPWYSQFLGNNASVLNDNSLRLDINSSLDRSREYQKWEVQWKGVDQPWYFRPFQLRKKGSSTADENT